jgi:hypothetical protein
MRFSHAVRKPLMAVSAISLVGLLPSMGLAKDDFGQKIEDLVAKAAVKATGFKKELELGQCTPQPAGYRTATQVAEDQLAVSKGLKVEYVTREAGNATDQMMLWPPENPTHIISAVEGGRTDLGGGKFNPSVQRINLATGAVETILRGLTSGDPIRITPWGTILFAEEASDGGAYEIINPLNTTNVTVTDRATGAVSGPDAGNVVKRTALPVIAWEGIVVLPNGVVYAGDELRPGTGTADKDGGSLFKFIPTTLRTLTTPIASLSESPLVAGTSYAARVSCTTGVQYGQGCDIGNAEWIPVSAANARNDADAGGATGYYRPEDMDRDSGYEGPGVRGCWANTWDEDAKSYGEILCFIDQSPETAVPSVVSQTRIYRLLEGNPTFNQPDNIHFQPISNAPFVLEDHPNGEIRACLPDGADANEQSDGCGVVACVKDDSAEPTGWFFSAPNAKGEMAVYVSIQHSNDTNMPKVDDYATDDIIKITGIKVKPATDGN